MTTGSIADFLRARIAAADGGVDSAAAPADAVVAPRGVEFAEGERRVADFIDHTLLRAEATAAEVQRLCDEARTHRFAAVCVNPDWVAMCAERLAGSGVRVATVIGFPLGANTPEAKRREAARAAADGATEVDMVIALGRALGGDWDHVADDISAVVDGAGERGALVKVILESAALAPAQIVRACELARERRAHYVKTSTGFHASGGATPEAVALMRLTVGDALGVKASGGVRDCAAALHMLASGATRIGTSSGVAMTDCCGRGPRPLHMLLAGRGKGTPWGEANAEGSIGAPAGTPGAY